MRSRYGKIFVACGVITLLSLGASAVATAQTYTITDVGPAANPVVGRTGLDLFAINNLGQVVGQSTNANGQFQAFLWQNGVMTDLPTLGLPFSHALGINDAGQIVGGASSFPNGVEHAVLWQKDSQGAYSITDLRTLGGLFSRAFGINNAGQVVGGSALASNTEARAFLWQNGQMIDLGTLGVFSEAFAINNSGQVVGESTTANGDVHAFLWQNGKMTDLGILADTNQIVIDINDAGQVARTETTANGDFHAVLWQNGQMTDLPTLGGLSGFVSEARGINNVGQVVGSASTANGDVREVLWQKDSQGVYRITDLDTLLSPDSGWNLGAGTVIAINDRGQIIGKGAFNGVLHVYLLSPVELLDPVPELLNGPTVTIDKELLASKGRLVLGVAADGVAQLVIRIPAKSVDEQITLTVLDAQHVVSVSQDENGAVADVNNPSFSSSVTVKAQDTTRGPMAFALYRAPTDFAKTNNTGDATAKDRTVNIRIERAGQPASQIPITIVRPPVMLIHGLWSNPKVWNDFKLAADSRFQVFRADYQETNGESVQTNTNNIVIASDVDLREFKSVSKVAAVQFDLVTHSMGGLLARNFATLPLYRRNTNYLNGDIHKLITLDTPHLGSQLANRLNASSPFCKLAFLLANKKVGGAINDLEVGSAAIAQLLQQTTPIKARLIAGQATTLQEVGSTAAFSLFTSLRVCRSLLPPGGFAELFSSLQDPAGHSDLIVSVISQLGKTIAVGRGDAAADLPYDGIEHTRIFILLMLGPAATDDSTIGQRVIDLLNTSVANPDFVDILP